MKVLQYPTAITSASLVHLRREVGMFEPLPGNMWIGIHDEPENTIEKYVLDSYDLYLKELYPTAIGFEWWFHHIKDDNSMIGFHSDHDEMWRRDKDGEMKYPLVSTVTYLTNHISPTIIWDTTTGSNEREVRNCPPTRVAFSIPEEGRFLTFDPRYIHGVLPYSKDRITLMYNVWDYRPDALHRVDKRTFSKDCHFFSKGEGRIPTAWLGTTESVQVDLWGKPISFKVPEGANVEGDFWSVTQ
jgi:hypothetical protein|tara:strand:+ start:365 stop:1093 length:729 start_codon:yes stop_codon:yes gene_type:complete